MTVMGAIFRRVFGEGGIGSDAVSRHGDGMHDIVLAPLTFPQPGDAESALGRIAARKRETLHWQKSIVDLLKLLNLDSGIVARRQLAYELGYSGSMEDNVAMNIWLHREVMRKLIQGGQKGLNTLLH